MPQSYIERHPSASSSSHYSERNSIEDHSLSLEVAELEAKTSFVSTAPSKSWDEDDCDENGNGNKSRNVPFDVSEKLNKRKERKCFVVSLASVLGTIFGLSVAFGLGAGYRPSRIEVFNDGNLSPGKDGTVRPPGKPTQPPTERGAGSGGLEIIPNYDFPSNAPTTAHVASPIKGKCNDDESGAVSLCDSKEEVTCQDECRSKRKNPDSEYARRKCRDRCCNEVNNHNANEDTPLIGCKTDWNEKGGDEATPSASSNEMNSKFAPAALNGTVSSAPDAWEPPKPILFNGIKVTYQPGHLVHVKEGILLSAGLNCNILAKSAQKVEFADGTVSASKFHANPDHGATFPAKNGGWIYVSNSEVLDSKGGVGGITFNRNGKAIKYEKLLRGTTMNCGGGKTPWGTWMSCEEVDRYGQIWEVDPSGIKAPKQSVLGGKGGRFESFTYDVRNETVPRFFYTEDAPNGALRRFTPSNPDWSKTNEMLHGAGIVEYLVMEPRSIDNSTGTYRWSKFRKEGRRTAEFYFPGSEGIDQADGTLYFVSKKSNAIITLDLDGDSYQIRSTRSGIFDGSPDQLTRLIEDDEQSLLYYTEEGGVDAGVHARDAEGNYFSILESPVYDDETTGLAFSPNYLHLYVAYQKNGILLDVFRDDGLPFNAKTLDVKYHKTA